MGQERVPNDLCIGEKRPRNTKKCEEKSCLEYMWKVGNWSKVCTYVSFEYVSSVMI